MLRRARHVPALAGAAISAGVPPTFTDLAFPAPATGWLLGRPAGGGRTWTRA